MSWLTLPASFTMDADPDDNSAWTDMLFNTNHIAMAHNSQKHYGITVIVLSERTPDGGLCLVLAKMNLYQLRKRLGIE